MTKEYTAHEIEKKVYDYIIKKTVKGYNFNFNPLDVSKEGIAHNLNLSIEEVEEAIETLSGTETGKTSNLERVISIEPIFEIWLPNTSGGQQIKDVLCESGLALEGVLNLLYSFLFLVICYFFIFEKPYLRDFLGLVNPDLYFVIAVILTALSIPFGKYLARKWYQANLLLQRVKGSKYYIYALIVLIIIIIISINKGSDITAILSGIAALANIALVVFQIIRDGKK